MYINKNFRKKEVKKYWNCLSKLKKNVLGLKKKNFGFEMVFWVFNLMNEKRFLFSRIVVKF